MLMLLLIFFLGNKEELISRLTDVCEKEELQRSLLGDKVRFIAARLFSKFLALKHQTPNTKNLTSNTRHQTSLHLPFPPSHLFQEAGIRINVHHYASLLSCLQRNRYTPEEEERR